jgi:predicted DCC family thiol-disulfide oxidoreductase YuxK
MVNFVIRQDKKRLFLFAPLQSPAGADLLQKWGMPSNSLDSFVLIDGGAAYTRSTAALRVMRKLPPLWRWTEVFWIVPLSLRNAVYNFIARNRYRWFGKRDSCMLPGPDVRSRFLGTPTPSDQI